MLTMQQQAAQHRGNTCNACLLYAAVLLDEGQCARGACITAREGGKGVEDTGMARASQEISQSCPHPKAAMHRLLIVLRLSWATPRPAQPPNQAQHRRTDAADLGCVVAAAQDADVGELVLAQAQLLQHLSKARVIGDRWVEGRQPADIVRGCWLRPRVLGVLSNSGGSGRPDHTAAPCNVPMALQISAKCAGTSRMPPCPQPDRPSPPLRGQTPWRPASVPRAP